MKPDLPFYSVITFFAVIAVMLVCVSFIFKNNLAVYNTYELGEKFNQFLPTETVTDLPEFEVEATDLTKFSVSFNYSQEHDIFIKIYDVIGNIVHQEVVTTKGKFKKEYNLTGSKTEVYIIEVGNKKGSKTKRVFLS